jgi:hypothetical protein
MALTAAIGAWRLTQRPHWECLDTANSASLHVTAEQRLNNLALPVVDLTLSWDLDGGTISANSVGGAGPTLEKKTTRNNAWALAAELPRLLGDSVPPTASGVITTTTLDLTCDGNRTEWVLHSRGRLDHSFTACFSRQSVSASARCASQWLSDEYGARGSDNHALTVAQYAKGVRAAMLKPEPIE